VGEQGIHHPLGHGRLSARENGVVAEKKIEDVEGIKNFNRLDYAFADHLSDENTYIFLKKEK